MPSVSIAIPSYSRSNDLDYLLTTISLSNVLPDEVVICDDNSPDQDLIDRIVEKWAVKFRIINVLLKYVKNPVNLGYDRNLKKLIHECSSDFLIFIGNDDAFTINGVGYILNSINLWPNIRVFSRSFLKFSSTIDSPSGVSRFGSLDCIFDHKNSNPKMYLRLCAFFGGLVLNRKWALEKETDMFDGTLYYQLYLFGCAYYEAGIGYISQPTVGARTTGIPLFGVAISESSVHRPGGYSEKARAKMWADILKISEYIDSIYLHSSKKEIHNELKTRFSFHVFEMYATKDIRHLFALADELHRLELMRHPVPLLLFLLVFSLRSWSRFVFMAIR
jgi:glycosyltransferase involved in cell wall biosynthesis